MSTLTADRRQTSPAPQSGSVESFRSATSMPRMRRRPAWLGTARFRLTAWYVGGLTAILAILGIATYVSLYAELLSDANAKLSIATNEIIGQLQGGYRAQTDQSLQNIVIRAPLSVPSAPTTRADAIFIRLIDSRSGATVAESPALRRFARLGECLPKPKFRGRARLPEFAFAGFSEETQMRVMTTSVPNSSELLQTAVSWDSSEDFLTGLTLAICCVCLLLLALSAAGCWRLVGRALAPIDEIVSEAELLSLDRVHPPRLAPRAQTDAEVGHLVDALNALLARLHNSISIQRQFSADASHELRTPLTILRGELELSLTRPRAEQEYKRVVASCLEETNRMIRIVQELSLLARNDNHASIDSSAARTQRAVIGDTEEIDAVAVCRQIVAAIQPIASERGLSIQLKADTKACTVRCREDSLRRIVTNLLDNAITYTGAGGVIAVAITSNDSDCVVEVSDTGIGIAESDLPHVFERFYRADKARVNTGGSGLGLSIVKSLAEAYGGTATIESQIGMGTTVAICLQRPLRRSNRA